jgi:hypothetical protein
LIRPIKMQMSVEVAKTVVPSPSMANATNQMLARPVLIPLTA